MTDAFEFLGEMVPFLAVLAVVSLLLMAGYWGLLGRRQELGAESRLPRQLMMGLLGVIGILIVLLSLPIGDTTRGQILSFLGAVLTAVIGLSATTFITSAAFPTAVASCHLAAACAACPGSGPATAACTSTSLACHHLSMHALPSR